MGREESKKDIVETGASHTRILVVEDNVTLGRVLAGTIKRLGCDTTVVGTVREAKECLAEIHVWVGVILDLILADGHGLGLFRWLRDRDPELPVLIHTGNPDHDSIHAAYDLGAEYLEKPSTTAQIERFLRKAEASVAARSDGPSQARALEAHALAWQNTNHLSDAETDVLVRAAQGRNRQTIAAERGVSLETIKKQVACLLAKLGDSSLREAVERLQTEAKESGCKTKMSRRQHSKT